MDPTMLVFVCIGVLFLVMRAKFFSEQSRNSNSDALDYFNAALSLRMVFMGVLSIAMLISAFAFSRNSDTGEYAMSYSFLAIALVGLLLGVLTILSRDAERILGELIRRTDSGNRTYLLIAFFRFAGAFFFAFFLFYPPVLSIG
jgi:cytochrome bd-type quinol oxidase subunit 2